MILYWIFFGIGFLATMSQVILLREFLVGSLGNEMSFGVGFSTWLVGIAVGAGFGALLGRWRGQGVLFRLAAVIWALVPSGLLYLVRVSRAWYPVSPGEIPPPEVMLAFGAMGILPAGVLVGFLFPLGAVLAAPRNAARPATGSTRGIGQIYVYEAAGSLAAGALFSFVLARHYHPVGFLAASGLLVVVLLGVAEAQRGLPPNRLRWVAVGAGGVLGLALLLPPAGPALERDSRARRTKALFPGLEPVDWAESRYQNLELLRLEEQYTLFANGHLLFSFPDPYRPREVADLVLTQHPSPANVLVIGTRDPQLLGAMRRHGLEDVEAVDLDPRVLELARPHFNEEVGQILDDPRLTLIDDDGRRHLFDTEASYDVVFLNLPDPVTALLGRFYTLEFFQAARDHLAEGGLFAFTFTGTPGLIGRESLEYGSILYRTAMRVFDQVLAVPGDTVFVFCSRKPDVFTRNAEVLTARYRERRLEPEEGAFRFYDLLWPERVNLANERLNRSGLHWISTDWHPRAYFFASLLWDRLVRARTVEAFRRLAQIPFWVCIAAVAVLPILRTPFRMLRRAEASARGDLLWSIATTGLVALALEIMFIFAFQNLYGYVYEKLGLVVGLFMVGLALGGGWATERYSARTPRGGRTGLHRDMAVADLAVAACAVLLLGFVWICGRPFALSELLFDGYLVVVGLLTGAQFPLAVRCYLETRKDVAVSAGALDAADHLGAAFGALLTGVLLIPLFGLAGPAVLLALLKLGTAVFHIFDWRGTA